MNPLKVAETIVKELEHICEHLVKVIARLDRMDDRLNNLEVWLEKNTDYTSQNPRVG